MNQKIEHVALDEDYAVTLTTTKIMDGVQLITCEEEREATLMINDADISLQYNDELAAILSNLNEYSAEQLLIALVQKEHLAS